MFTLPLRDDVWMLMVGAGSTVLLSPTWDALIVVVVDHDGV